jgi:hypothetical protein
MQCSRNLRSVPTRGEGVDGDEAWNRERVRVDAGDLIPISGRRITGRSAQNLFVYIPVFLIKFVLFRSDS